MVIKDNNKQVYSGIGVGDAKAWGKTVVLSARPKIPAEAKSQLSSAEEQSRLLKAIKFVATDIRATADKADQTTSEILQALLALMEDPALIEEAQVHLTEGWNAETSVVRAMQSFTELLAGDDLFSERIADLNDLALRVVANLTGQDMSVTLPKEGPIIVVAEDLSPAETALFTDAVVGVITSGGGPTSHTAIICRQRNIPALVAVKNASAIVDGVGLVIDALSGEAFRSDSPPKNINTVARRARRGDSIIEVKGNVGSVSDSISLAKTKASGIGLMRTELLFLDRSQAPSLEEQTTLYSDVLSEAPTGEVIFRTLDAGSDKPLPYLGIVKEENPSLGIRGFRLNDLDKNILNIQLKALSQAQKKTGRDLSVMAPMIATIQEAKEFAQLAHEHKLLTVGVMVETPSICAMLPELKGVVDFVSIGTNDLSQYLFAADRQNSGVANLLNPWQPALLRTIARVCDDAKVADIKVGVCGEAAADPLLAVVLAGLGVQSVSVAAPAVEKVSEYLSSVTIEEAQAVAKAALAGASPEQSKQLALAKFPN
jgi:phosphotransferase system enzyme I (PtsI)